MWGFYLLGKLRFAHDSETPHLTVPRLFFAIFALGFSIYMIPGLWGAPLKPISSFLPHQGSPDFDVYTATLGGSASTASYDPVQGKSAATGPTGEIVSPVTKKNTVMFNSPLRLHASFDYQ